MVTVLLHDWKYFDEMNEVFAEYFGWKPPARSTIRGERWPQGALVAMSAIAVANTEQERLEELQPPTLWQDKKNIRFGQDWPAAIEGPSEAAPHSWPSSLGENVVVRCDRRSSQSGFD